MKFTTGSFRLTEKNLSYATGVFILFVIILRYFHFPIASPGGGDEPFYTQEAEYLAKYGFYKALSQGTSFTYSLLLFSLGKLCSISYLTAGRIWSVIFFTAGCWLLYKCLSAFTGIDNTVKYLCVIFYTTMSASWLWRCLPDCVCTSFILAALYMVFSSKSYLHLVYAAILLFLAFSCKPIAMFVLPGLFLYLLFNGWHRSPNMKKLLRLAVFTSVFGICFVAYHVPGYNTYHRLMLEDKSHQYNGGQRIESTTSWTELNNYFLLYHDEYNKQNKWKVTFDEVIEFKKQHPDVVLQLSYTQFITKHPVVFAKSTAEKFFFYLPYHIQGGLFFAKWTVINKWINNQTIIYAITLLLIGGIMFVERKIIKDNVLLFLIPFLFFASLSFYCISQLEDNWSFFCLPFLALPVLGFINKHMNIPLFIVLQFLYTMILIKNG